MPMHGRHWPAFAGRPARRVVDLPRTRPVPLGRLPVLVGYLPWLLPFAATHAPRWRFPIGAPASPSPGGPCLFCQALLHYVTNGLELPPLVHSRSSITSSSNQHQHFGPVVSIRPTAASLAAFLPSFHFLPPPPPPLLPLLLIFSSPCLLLLTGYNRQSGPRPLFITLSIGTGTHIQ